MAPIRNTDEPTVTIRNNLLNTASVTGRRSQEIRRPLARVPNVRPLRVRLGGSKTIATAIRPTTCGPANCLRYAEAMKPGDRDLDATLTRLRELFEPRPEILEAYLFGSTARGAEQPHSDLDVAVFIDEAAAKQGGFGYQADLTTDVMAALGTNAVDVVLLNRAPPLLYHRVLSDGMRIVSRNLRATTTREARALSRYCDFVPQLDKIDAASRTTSPSKVTEP